jgi:hypothetical protein
MGRIYTVVFNSAVAGAASTNSEQFFFDWSQLEEGRYKVTFSFMSAVNSVTQPTGTFVPNIFIDLGQGAYTSIASSNVPTSAAIGAVFNANFLGSLEFKSFTSNVGSYGYYCATSTTNPPFYLDNRPRNNAVNITINNNGATQSTPFTPVPGAYTLTLQLHRQPEEDYYGKNPHSSA